MRLLRAPLSIPVVVLSLVALVSPSAQAQVNAEVLRTQPLRAGWGGGFDASFALLRGNTDLLDLSGAARVQHQALFDDPPAADGGPEVPWVRERYFVTASGRFSERSGKTAVSQTYSHARWTRMWHRRIGSDLFLQHQYNEFQRLKARALAGVGARLELVHTAPYLAWMGVGYMLEYNRIDVAEGAPDRAETWDRRFTSYFAQRVALFADRLLLQHTTYHQPRDDAFRDFRLLSEAELMARVTDTLALGTVAAVLHDSRPPTGVENTDLRLVSTARFSF